MTVLAPKIVATLLTRSERAIIDVAGLLLLARTLDRFEMVKLLRHRIHRVRAGVESCKFDDEAGGFRRAEAANNAAWLSPSRWAWDRGRVPVPCVAWVPPRWSSEKAANHATQEDDLGLQLAEVPCHYAKGRKFGGARKAHESLRLSSSMASFRSRARPIRNASTRATSS